MRKQILLLAIIFSGLFLLHQGSQEVFAQAGKKYACEWSSTQARVQVNESSPWEKEQNLGCVESFNIGSFHNETGEFARDTNLTVIYPDGNERKLSWWTSNGKSIKVRENGVYVLRVDTKYRYGSACEDTAKVLVNCPDFSSIPDSPKPTHKSTNTSGKVGKCEYQNTQARVQQSRNHDWAEEIEIGCFERFNVGLFHNHTGQFADDTEIQVVAELRMPWNENVILEKNYRNGDSVFSVFPGLYKVNVTTRGQTGENCQADASVMVKCGRWPAFMQGWTRVN